MPISQRLRCRHLLPILLGLACLGPGPVLGRDSAPISAVIQIDNASGPRFDPVEALGAGIDGGAGGAAGRLLTRHNIAAMRSARLTRLTYRLRTELGIENWHWNPEGQWSDPDHQQGYWTSSDRAKKPIRVSWGYKLPRRGDTVDNANDKDFSRLTDGDETSFWKSNPYLDAGFLKDGRPHDQWLILRFDDPVDINAVRIAWGTPYATAYKVQYWSSDNDYGPGAHWITFDHGVLTGGAGGDVVLKLAERPVSVKYLRVLLERGSHTAPPGAKDWRDRAGFAVREIGAGRIGPDGKLVDLVRHAPDKTGQTFTHVSSTDPWHRSIDRDPNLEQPGLDRVFRSGLGNGRPIMLPVGVLFDTPKNAAAALRYVQRRHYPVAQVELGEEPDGQFGNADDYAALYLAWVDRLRPIAPSVRFGGPSSQSALSETWLNSDPDRSWNRHFIRALQDRGRLSDLQFYSFEFYPFDDICGDIPAKLVEEDRLMDRLMARLTAEGVGPDIPRIITEYGFSAYSGRAMAEMPSALLMANIIGQFLNEGGSAAYLFGYGPNVPVNQNMACAGYGNMALHMADPAGQAATPLPSYHTARLLTGDWMMAKGVHRFLPVEMTGAADLAVRLYAIARPDGKLGLLAINRSPDRTVELHIMAQGAKGGARPIAGQVRVSLFGPDQYAWIDQGPASRPARSDPPERTSFPTRDLVIALKPMTLAAVIAPR
ncbi:discoidin domain-containing protein [Novosphingobium humi]|uniref:discoidin domain-containing protein n=1 Tax=Novosphingobium humi TaxID=2282397 RepID=UPI0025B24C98|nr:discoidin domain-containing protein [Novosphingobium humi]WJS97593.1 discoidin domain-containing protein [Novosphingobium humi]